MIRYLLWRVFKSCRTKIDGQVIFSVRSGTKDGKTPVLFIHGALVSHLYFMPTAVMLEDEYEILAPDLPGHGESSKPEHALPPATQARILRDWISMIGIEKVTVLAHSYGCAIASELAVAFPEAIERLVLMSPAADPNTPIMFVQFLRLVMDGFYENPVMFLVLFRDTFCMSLRRAIQTAQIMIDFDYFSKLPLITMKTLVMRGEKDTLVSQEWATKVAELLPNGELKVIANGPHNIQFTKPKQVAEAVTKFLAED